MNFLNNPFDIVIQAVRELYPETKADIQFDGRIKFLRFGPFKFGHCGETIFPDDGSIPLINISTHIPFRAMPEILAHELAHVVAGEEAGHGERWREVFRSIHAKFDEIVDRP